MNKKIHKKPTGHTSLFKVSNKGTTEVKMDFPQTKEEIESTFMSAFVKQSLNESILPFKITYSSKNQENDLDYIIKTEKETMFCELTELVPENKMSRGGYRNAPRSFTVGEMTDHLYHTIKKKDIYVLKDQSILLVYITHGPFCILNEEQLILIRSMLISDKYKINAFKYIFLLFFLDPDSLITHNLCPGNVKKPSAKDRSRMREERVLHLRPTTITSNQEDGDYILVAQPQIIGKGI